MMEVYLAIAIGVANLVVIILLIARVEALYEAVSQHRGYIDESIFPWLLDLSKSIVAMDDLLQVGKYGPNSLEDGLRDMVSLSKKQDDTA